MHFYHFIYILYDAFYNMTIVEDALGTGDWKSQLTPSMCTVINKFHGKKLVFTRWLLPLPGV